VKPQWEDDQKNEIPAKKDRSLHLPTTDYGNNPFLFSSSESAMLEYVLGRTVITARNK